MPTSAQTLVPHEVSQVITKLQEAGFEAYLVGGCVRDILRNKKPKDWDVTTDARPERITELFEHTFHENDYGTVSIVNDETDDETQRVVEVTPYRIESGYSDSRRPDSVEFSDSIEDDLKRRDFTINAIAFDPIKDIFVDPYKGQKHLEDRVIQAVGDPKDRFKEDALRILRAVRLFAEIGFEIEENTKQALSEYAPSLGKIAQERIRDEFSRIILSPNPEKALFVTRETGIIEVIIPELTETFHVKQNQAHSYDVWTHLLKSVQHAADKNHSLDVRLAALFHDIGKPRTKRWDESKNDWSFHGHEVVGAKMATKVLKRLCFSKKVVSRVTTLIRWHMFFSDPEQITLSAVRRMVRNVGKENVEDLINLRVCDRIGTGRPKEKPYRLRKYQAMIEEAMRDPISVKSLALDGEILMKELDMSPGPKIGFILHALLEEVLDDPRQNTQEILLKRAHELAALPEEKLKEKALVGKKKVEKEEEKNIQQIRKRHHVQ